MQAGRYSLEVCEGMLEHVATLLARSRRVTFLADHGFRDRDWARKCRSLDWNYIIRIANNITITFADGRTITAEALGIKPGQRRYLPRVRLTLQADWECNLAITWTRATTKCQHVAMHDEQISVIPDPCPNWPAIHTDAPLDRAL